ncbi:MAG: LysM peptidoglycan-binding domain-containing protein [Pedobacter sp.]
MKFPQEFNNLVETFEHGEAVLHVQHDDKKADTYYLMAFQKGELLRTELKRYDLRMAEQQRQRLVEQAARIEEERLLRKAVEAEERLREQERMLAEEASKAVAAEKKTSYSKESSSQQTPTYTVRRGETLPQIAARTEIYNDSSLWPIIYRANRDQIRNPKQLWPGQVLKIPRHFSRDEAIDAKRYSGRK